MGTNTLGRNNALVTLHGNRLGISQQDANGNSALLLDGLVMDGVNGIPVKSGQNTVTALAGGGQTSLSSFIAKAAVTVLKTVATASDSFMLPSLAGAFPSSGLAISATIINASSIAAAIFPSSGDAINALGANASFAMASSGVTNFHALSSGQWYTK